VLNGSDQFFVSLISQIPDKIFSYSISRLFSSANWGIVVVAAGRKVTWDNQFVRLFYCFHLFLNSKKTVRATFPGYSEGFCHHIFIIAYEQRAGRGGNGSLLLPGSTTDLTACWVFPYEGLGLIPLLDEPDPGFKGLRALYCNLHRI
jgi:hypothetical protein